MKLSNNRSEFRLLKRAQRAGEWVQIKWIKSYYSYPPSRNAKFGLMYYGKLVSLWASLSLSNEYNM